MVTASGVVPSERSEDNCLVPDLGITCAPPTGEHLMLEPLVLIEILSPTNVSRTRAQHPRIHDDTDGERDSGSAFRRHRGGGPQTRTRRYLAAAARDVIDAAMASLRLDSIGFAAPLRDAYRTSGLA